MIYLAKLATLIRDTANSVHGAIAWYLVMCASLPDDRKNDDASRRGPAR